MKDFCFHDNHTFLLIKIQIVTVLLNNDALKGTTFPTLKFNKAAPHFGVFIKILIASVLLNNDATKGTTFPGFNKVPPHFGVFIKIQIATVLSNNDATKDNIIRYHLILCLIMFDEEQRVKIGTVLCSIRMKTIYFVKQ